MERAVVLAVFVTAYALFVFLPGRRSIVAIAAAFLLLLTGTLTPHEALHAVNWNVIGIFVGMLIVADVFIESRFPAWFAEVIVNRAPNTAWAILFICLMTSALSAIVENVATLLIVAPVAISLAKKLEINPFSMIIAIAIASNLQGAATLIGDPPSMLLGGYARMTFLDFFVYQGKPSMFFATQVGALASFVLLYFVFRGHREKGAVASVEKVEAWWPTILLGVLIMALAGSSFFDKEFKWLAGTLCMAFGLGMLVPGLLRSPGRVLAGMRRLDWDTTFFLMGIFVIVESLTATGWVDVVAQLIAGMIGGSVFWGYVVLVLFSMIFSGFIDNVPFLAAMLPVAGALARDMDTEPALFLFGLLLGASLGGNITPIGASANIVGVGLLRKEGHTVTFWEFGKISIPFTLAAIVPASVFVWLVWGP